MAGVVQETLQILADGARKSDAILVGYSGGKDSLAVLDLCVRSFKRVECFYMYLIPGLRCIEEMLDYARQRWGVTIHQFPHWVLQKFVTSGVFCNNHYSLDDLPEWKLKDVYNFACIETGIPLIATGAKRADSLWRKRSLSTSAFDDVIYPIVGWNKFDVVSYLKARAIPLPNSSGRSATGVDLSTPSILWLHDNYPDDFARLCEVFPYAEAVIHRRTWYGVT